MDMMDNIQIVVLDGKKPLQNHNDIKKIFPEEDILIITANNITEVRTILKQGEINFLVFEINDFIAHQKVIRLINTDHPEIEIFVLDRDNAANRLPLDPRLRCKVILLSKPVDVDHFRKSIEIAKYNFTMQDSLKELDKNFEQFCNEIRKKDGRLIIGCSKQIKSIASLILLITKSDDTSVLITGESGTGKELVARAIHTLSRCYKKIFYAVNCAAIPESLFESEFFGYGKGAFTGAAEKSTGWFELANNGTLFLDEITELPKTMQTKFLRILDDKVIQKIGSHQEIKVNLRIISASNQDPEKLSNNSVLRKDLFHRLNTIHIHIPPLRERKEDIPVLIDHFIKEESNKLHKPLKPVSELTLERLMHYSFPGNVRELRNMIENAVLLCQGPKITWDHFPVIRQSNPAPFLTHSTEENYNLAALDSDIILEALNKTKFNKSRAAALLNISRQALDRKIMKLGIIF